MTFTLTHRALKDALPIYAMSSNDNLPKALTPSMRQYAEAVGFDGKAGSFLLLPANDGQVAGAVFGLGKSDDPMIYGALARDLPDGDWQIDDLVLDAVTSLTAMVLGSYQFDRYKEVKSRSIRLSYANADAVKTAERLGGASNYTRDLINTPTSDMGPEALETTFKALASEFKAKTKIIKGDQLLKQDFPMIHAVGRASAEAPRLLDMTWGPKTAPMVTLVGKGVCFDTGGLDIKPASSMLLMKKDMGGAANVLGLARSLMGAKAKIRLRVLIPAVENSISDNAFRPSDILTARDGQTVEIGHTDAEGRLVLADALVLASEENPELIIDMATLTGAARVALGPDLPPFFTDDEALANETAQKAQSEHDPLWRLPLWQPYAQNLSSPVADVNNVTKDGFAGSITAALFLKRFVKPETSWMHLDLYGWNPKKKPQSPIGGEAQSIRALDALIIERYGVS